MASLGSAKVAVGGQSDPDDLHITRNRARGRFPGTRSIMPGGGVGFAPAGSRNQFGRGGHRRAQLLAAPVLGLHAFAEDSGAAERILDATESGDAAINDWT